MFDIFLDKIECLQCTIECRAQEHLKGRRQLVGLGWRLEVECLMVWYDLAPKFHGRIIAWGFLPQDIVQHSFAPAAILFYAIKCRRIRYLIGRMTAISIEETQSCQFRYRNLIFKGTQHTVKQYPGSKLCQLPITHPRVTALQRFIHEDHRHPNLCPVVFRCCILVSLMRYMIGSLAQNVHGRFTGFN